MEILNWSIQTSPLGELPVIVSEYVLNELGIFVKRERRMPKSAPFTAVTGFRVGYAAIPGMDYRAAPMDRRAILWHKVASVTGIGESGLTIRGNQNDEIALIYSPENKDAVARYIAAMRQLHPPVAPPDRAAAAWICWRDDDEWGEPFAPLADMIREETGTKRYIEPEVLEETRLTGTPDDPAAPDSVPPASPGAAEDWPKFCGNCGAALRPGSHFCGSCGARIVL
jgi:hypothetical protein